jgi:hypothetical protein
MSATPTNTNQPTPDATPVRKTREEEIRELEELLGDKIPPLIVEGRETFRRELPDLLKRYPGKWVIYSGSRRLGIARTKAQLVQECLKSGLKRGEFIAFIIEPHSFDDDEVELPLDV